MSSGQQNQPPASALVGTSPGTTAPGSRMPPDKETEHLWRYFALHAQQRISVFNFFVVFSGVIATGIGGALQAGRPMTFLVVVLGVLLMVLSFVFFRLDRRNSDLVKISERALRTSELSHLPAYAQIFEREANVGPGSAFPEDRKTQTHWTFGRSFKFLFAMMGSMGLVASGYAIYQWYWVSAIKSEQTQSAETLSRAGVAPATSPAVGSGSAGQAPRRIDQAPVGQPVGTESPRAGAAPVTKEVPEVEKSKESKN